MAHEFAHHIQKYLFSAIEVEYTYQREIHYREVDDILDLRVFSLHHHFDSSHQAEQIVELHADYLAGVLYTMQIRLPLFSTKMISENDSKQLFMYEMI